MPQSGIDNLQIRYFFEGGMRKYLKHYFERFISSDLHETGVFINGDFNKMIQFINHGSKTDAFFYTKDKCDFSVDNAIEVEVRIYDLAAVWTLFLGLNVVSNAFAIYEYLKYELF